MTPTVLLLAVLAAGSVLLLALGARRSLTGASSLSDRLSRFQPSATILDTPAALAPKGKAKWLNLRSSDVVQGMNQRLQERGSGDQLRRRLAQADLKITVVEFLVFNGVMTVVGAFVGLVLLGTVVHMTIFTVVGLIGPHWWLRMRQGARRKKFANQLADTIGMMANSLRAGYSVLAAMDLISREMGPPVADEFHRVTAEVGLGLPPEDALANLMRRISSTDLDLMVTAMNIQREVGGNLSEILDVIANTIRERVRIQGEIRTLTAQQKMASYIITALPMILALIIYTMDHHYIATFWEDKSCGLPMMGASFVLMAVGTVVMRRIVAIDV